MKLVRFWGWGPTAAGAQRGWWPCGSRGGPEEAESKWGLKERFTFSTSPQQLEKDLRGNPTLGFPGDLMLFLWFQCSDLARGFYTYVFPPANWWALTQFILFFLIQKDKEFIVISAVLIPRRSLQYFMASLPFHQPWDVYFSSNIAVCSMLTRTEDLLTLLFVYWRHQSLFFHEPPLSRYDLQTAVQHRGVLCASKIKPQHTVKIQVFSYLGF